MPKHFNVSIGVGILILMMAAYSFVIITNIISTFIVKKGCFSMKRFGKFINNVSSPSFQVLSILVANSSNRETLLMN